MVEGERGGAVKVHLSIQGTLLYSFDFNFLHDPEGGGGATP